MMVEQHQPRRYRIPGLKPDTSYDKDGVWSGSATILQDGTPALLYTGSVGQLEYQCLALPADPSDPLLTHWVKYSGNPILANPPAGIDPNYWRDDTTAWRSGGAWKMLVGARLNTTTGAALLYTSTDFKNWTYLHPFWSGDAWGNPPIWECPDFYPLGDQHVLKFSSFSAVERLDCQTFTPTSNTVLVDFGGLYYASKTFLDPVPRGGRRIIYGWVCEDEPNAASRGWQGVQALPRVVTINKALNLLVAEPIPELANLRNASSARHFAHLVVKPGEAVPLIGVHGVQLEIEAVFKDLRVDAKARVGVRVLESHSGKQRNFTSVYYELPGPGGRTAKLCIDRSQSGTVGSTKLQCGEAPIFKSDHELNLRIFVDHSMIEAFAHHGRHRGTSRVYIDMSREDELGVSVFSESSRVTTQVDTWQLLPCYSP
ncbi:Cell wall invertase [Balamuthia mandrillaris]